MNSAATLSIEDVTSEALENLSSAEGPCFSLYLPTAEIGDVTKAGVLLREIANDVNERFWEAGVDSADADEMLAVLDDLAMRADFWQDLPAGLALFRSLDLFQAFAVPGAVEQQVVVGDAFDLDQLNA